MHYCFPLLLITLVTLTSSPAGDALVVSSQSVVGGTVAVVVVVMGLVMVVLVLALRHRRLARSFLNFANSRYSHAQGTTSLSANDHNLGEWTYVRLLLCPGYSSYSELGFIHLFILKPIF